MPRDRFGPEHEFLSRDALLSFEEITRLVAATASLGATKVRLTGGEPLMRAGLETLVAMLDGLDSIADLTMTTNGSLLTRKVARLAEAGLDRVSVSLDAIDDSTFRSINDVGFGVAPVLEGIEAAAAAGLGPVKINAVIKRGVNDHQILDMVRFFRGTGHVLRFIEYMDVGATNNWRLDDVVPAAEILRTIDAVFPVEPLEPAYRGEVARRYRFRDGAGEVGLIGSVSQPFCGDCTRLRISADGVAFTCLFAGEGTDLRTLLRSGASDEELAEAITRLWSSRSDRYSETRTSHPSRTDRIEMSYIGG